MFAAGVSLVTSQWLFDTLSQLYHQYQTPAAYVLGVLTQPLLAGLLSRLPSKEIMPANHSSEQSPASAKSWFSDRTERRRRNDCVANGFVPTRVRTTGDRRVPLRRRRYA